MKYEKAIVKICDLGEEEILTCSTPTIITGCNNIPTTGGMPMMFPWTHIIHISWPTPKWPVWGGRKSGRR